MKQEERVRRKNGEGGIRTHGTPKDVHLISSQTQSTTLAPLQKEKRAQEESNLWPSDPQSDALSI